MSNRANRLAAIVPWLLVAACGELSSGGATDAVPDARPGSASDAGAPVLASSSDGSSEASSNESTCRRIAQASEAIFVTSNGSDSDHCGNPSADWSTGDAWSGPCRTIQHALQRGSTVFVGSGSIETTEAIALRSGVVIEGGWRRTPIEQELSGRVPPPPSYRWEKDCEDGNANVTTVTARPPTAIVADSIGGAATVRDLQIQIRAGSTTIPAPAGTSVLAVRALGATTTLHLEDVSIAAGAASDGAPGLTGATGASGGDDCPASDGAAASTVGAHGSDADGGAFIGGDYQATAGGAGSPGAAGHAGPLGANGTCVDCVTQCSAAAPCSIVSSVRQCGARAKSGCGGEGGAGGQGGGGGGSSVALVAWDASVFVLRGALIAGDGGDGAMGGAGGSGGSGGVGQTGAANPAVACSKSCEFMQGACTGTQPAAGEGGLGSTGGAGTAGGAGGRGSAGSSFAIVRGGSGRVKYDKTTLAHGMAGNGPGGAAGDELVVP